MWRQPGAHHPLLSQQLMSVLKIPGIEALLDNWCNKQCTSGEYRDIFNRDICRKCLRAPDGSLFFSNLPHEGHGPSGELRIGVNLGVDWYILISFCAALTYSHNRFSYICSNIAPSHFLCPTSFSILLCSAPPSFYFSKLSPSFPLYFPYVSPLHLPKPLDCDPHLPHHL